MVIRFLILCMFVISLNGCAMFHRSEPYISTKTRSEFQQGKRDFECGYYKRAMRLLLPLACDGVGEAEYAVGYMFYYGYGVCQDTDIGEIWIKRAAKKGYPPAVNAECLIKKDPPLLHYKQGDAFLTHKHKKK